MSGRHTSVTFPTNFPLDFLGKLVGLPNGNHMILSANGNHMIIRMLGQLEF